ncbi:MAG: hypothetical protein HPY83_02280 [Anaerolineae bacterium]|nr:hypothetical protein [Anaerolineae bacterium]
MQLVHEMQALLAEDVPAIPVGYPHCYTIVDAEVLDTWFHTPGGYASGIPISQNKLVFLGDRLQVTGNRLQVTGDRLQVTGDRL